MDRTQWKRIASIPFTRNLFEQYARRRGTDYLKLTSLLHQLDSGS